MSLTMPEATRGKRHATLRHGADRLTDRPTSATETMREFDALAAYERSAANNRMLAMHITNSDVRLTADPRCYSCS